jgi:hypothetical protein
MWVCGRISETAWKERCPRTPSVGACEWKYSKNIKPPEGCRVSIEELREKAMPAWGDT